MLQETIRFEDFELDPRSFELRHAGGLVKLERIPLQLLFLLAENRDRLVSREEILQAIWGKDVFVDADNSINTAVRKARQALKDDPENPRFLRTIPGKGYRFVAPTDPIQKIEPAVATGSPVGLAPDKSPVVEEPRSNSRSRILIPGVLFLLAIGVAAFFHFHRVQALSEKDSIVLADFANSTGDAVFDDTLKQALAVELSQSPFLNILSDEKMAETMQMMGRSANERVNEKTALEICQRTRSAAVLAGSFATLGSKYVIGLSAVACRTGDTLAKEQLRASSKEEVLSVVDRAATKLRGALGESLSTIQKFDIPVEQATTPSLEALQAYSLGQKNLMAGNMVAAVSAFKSAVSIDPNFAMAYAVLGSTYSNLGTGSLATENTRKAHELGQRVSERERFYIESHYHMFVTGNVEKGTEVFELWAQVYPRDAVPPFNLAAGYGNIGQFDKALEEARKTVRLDPGSALNYAQLAYFYLALNRPTDARATAEEVVAKKLDFPELHPTLYTIAFAQNDNESMAREVAWAAGKHGVEDILLACAADTAAYSGRLRIARDLSHRAMISAQQADKTELSAAYQAASALRESLFGNGAEVRREAAPALAVSGNEDILFMTALARAKAGDARGAQVIANEMAKRFPEDSIVQFIYLPTLRAQIAIKRNNPASAIEILQNAAPYELGVEGGCGFELALYPVYVRGEAYLASRQGREAATEFQKILDHRGVVLMAPIGALAHLGMGRAYALQGETVKARAAYQDFFTLWKDADPDVPALIAAKAEYTKLK